MNTQSDEFTLPMIIPPGEHIQEMLDERGMTQTELARRMGRPVQAINEIVRGKKAITAETAIQLEATLSMSAQTWLNLESSYRLALARLGRDRRGDYAYVLERFQADFFSQPLELRNEGWDRFVKDIEHLGVFWTVYEQAVQWLTENHPDLILEEPDPAKWTPETAFVRILEAYSLVH